MPEGWVWTSLGEIFLHNTGKALNASDRKGKLLSYITTSNLYWDRFELSSIKEMYFTEEKIEKCTVKKGDLLVCEGGDIGRAAIWNQEYDIRIQNHIHRLRGFGGINQRLFLFWLMFMKNEGMIGGKGIGLMGLSSRELDKMMMPLPPINEEKSIVDKIDILFNAIDALDYGKESLSEQVSAAKAKILDLAIQGKLVPQDPFDEPAIKLLQRVSPSFTPSHNLHYDAKLPDGWCVARLEEVAEYGDTSNVDVTTITSSSWVLELEDIEKDTAFILEKKKKSDREINGVRHSFRKGQILYSKLRTYLNKVLIATEDGFCSTEIVPITANKALLSEYLLIVLRSPYFLEYTASCGYGVKMPRLGTNDAKKAIIPIPPHAEQVRIVKKVSDLMTVISSL